MSNEVKILCYGTLKRGGPLHVVLEKVQAKFMGYDSITGTHYMADMGPFPAVFDDETGDDWTIFGEVWCVDDDGLAAIDRCEGHPHYFERRKVITDSGVRVWMYFFDREYEQLAQDVMFSGCYNPSTDEKAYWKEWAES